MGTAWLQSVPHQPASHLRYCTGQVHVMLGHYRPQPITDHMPCSTQPTQRSSQLPWIGAFLVVCASLAAPLAQAQGVHRIVGPDGRVTFSDRPQPGSAQPRADTAQAASSAGNASNAQLPYALRQSADRYPVTLYSSKDCEPCEEARNYLRGRGVPFSERTVETAADVTALKKLSGQDGLPFATIGSQHLKGFASDNWAQYLNAAGYPVQSALPASYRSPAARPLTTPAPAADAAKPAERAAPAQTPATPAPGTPNPHNPAGLRF